MRKTVVRHLFKGEHYLNRTEDLHSDYRASVARARLGSELLEEALNWQFRKFAHAHKITERQARALLMDRRV